MEEAVIVKGSASALRVHLSDTLPFQELLEKVGEQFRAASDFYGDETILLEFRGRVLDEAEEAALLDAITSNCDLKIPYLLDADQEAFYAEYLELKAFKEEAEKAAARQQAEEKPQGALERTSLKQEYSAYSDIFYKGTLRSGSEMTFMHSVVVLGDVKEGATIGSAGNIIVLGALKGNAYAGMDGNANAFVIALSMEPAQIRIADFIARAPDKVISKGKKSHFFRRRNGEKIKKGTKEKGPKFEPQIAFADPQGIYIEPLGKESYNEIMI